VAAKPKTEHPQVGALCWRRDGDRRLVLLVTSRDTRRWVIPKGNRMPEKSDWLAAAQEAMEEAGVQGSVGPEPLGAYAYEKRLKTGRKRATRVEVYGLEVLIQLGAWPESNERDRRWVTIEQAIEAVDEPGLRDLLKRFGQG